MTNDKMYKPKKYIISEREIVRAVKFGLEQSINDSSIIERLMRPVLEELETVLEDDCEPWRGEEE